MEIKSVCLAKQHDLKQNSIHNSYPINIKYETHGLMAENVKCKMSKV